MQPLPGLPPINSPNASGKSPWRPPIYSLRVPRDNPGEAAATSGGGGGGGGNTGGGGGRWGASGVRPMAAAIPPGGHTGSVRPGDTGGGGQEEGRGDGEDEAGDGGFGGYSNSDGFGELWCAWPRPHNPSLSPPFAPPDRSPPLCPLAVPPLALFVPRPRIEDGGFGGYSNSDGFGELWCAWPRPTSPSTPPQPRQPPLPHLSAQRSFV
jgi:hypothetical protein